MYGVFVSLFHFVFAVLGVEHGALCMLGKCFATETMHLALFFFFFTLFLRKGLAATFAWGVLGLVILLPHLSSS
jgi:hypothetical protein